MDGYALGCALARVLDASVGFGEVNLVDEDDFEGEAEPDDQDVVDDSKQTVTVDHWW